MDSGSRLANVFKSPRKLLRRVTKAVMRSYHYKLPKYDMPIRFRPWFLVFTSLIMLLLALLGFTNFSHALPLNDKLLHFLCLMIATGVFYFIFDVEEEARRIWFWRHAGLIFTGIICFFFGDIVSEIVQSMLPYKEFQMGDILANLCGSSIGLYIAYYLEKYYRHRREIARLYRPLDTDEEALISDSEEDRAEPLLPTHNPAAGKSATGKIRLEDVWDEREDVFDVGEDSDDEQGGSRAPGQVPAPKIVVDNPW
ncbi:hypothetical protein GLOTRDRAFT_38655 [Gloeophyllum trabeum ATCC 11539]|uniref:VanZ-like domain-containing protein n=1 Tax=Gloeophyllum trabeum (strain ATCC 11539 / FP-39264 / Madison 617) TaxID=670483 RepID=S7QB84_GLOTA|nr:uncharacterized protein GLOTRDRAFT_38655 [Gloeophyllum trabeum ATCC 11539]EPQ57201.1 hypothetical protein GLOTRDRAFT_38655 [Gloeophyllum trabeum ATCC 11539]